MLASLPLWLLGAYLSGSIPFGLLFARARGVDLRAVGSGNIGATNAMRVVGRFWGGVCFLLDVLKGTGPTLAAGLALGYGAEGWGLSAPAAWQWLSIAAASVLGHVFPVWLGFRGGKGVATAFGALLGVWPVLTIPALAAGLTWLIIAVVSRYVSLASVIAAVASPVYVLGAAGLAGQSAASLVPVLTVALGLAVLVVLRHRDNLARLRAGTEGKIGEKDPAEPDTEAAEGAS
jgi:glycerol-3-phosphate acyltransferase PlsY